MNTVEQRAAMLGEYIIDRQATVRDAAKRLRHIRGGEATREKYLHIRQRGMS